MSKQEELSDEMLDGVIDHIVGSAESVPFGNKMPQSGDVCLVLRAGGGLEMLSVMTPDGKDAEGKPIDLNQLSLRGVFLMALFKMAQHRAMMRDVIRIVLRETKEGRGSGPRLHG